MKKKRALIAGLVGLAVVVMSSVSFVANAATDPKDLAGAASAARQEIEKRRTSLDLTFDLGDGFDSGRLDTLINEVQGSKSRLGDIARQRLQSSPARLKGPASDGYVDFDGDLKRDGSKINISIQGGEVYANVNWWQTALASTVALIIAVGGDALCVATLSPAAHPFCSGIAGASGELVKNIIVMAIDQKLTDKNEWGNALVNTMFAFIGGVAWAKTGVGKWIADKFPGVLAKLSGMLRSAADKLSNWWSAVKFGCGHTADFLIELGPVVRSTADRISHSIAIAENPDRPSPPGVGGGGPRQQLK